VGCDCFLLLWFWSKRVGFLLGFGFIFTFLVNFSWI
jgi:hypothetical protein